MTDKDIVVIYISQFSDNVEDLKNYENHLILTYGDETTKIIVLANDIVEGVTRL